MACALRTAASVAEARVEQALRAARVLLEQEGEAALTMRRLAEALESGGGSLAGIAAAYRAWGRAHPALYGLVMDRRFPRDDLPAGLEERVARPLVAVLGDDPARVRAAWASAHGLLTLELAGRFPPDADLDAAWAAYAAAFSA